MYLTLYLLSAVIITAYACSEESTFQRLDFDVSKDAIPNMALKGHVISTLEVSSVPDCQRECIMNSRCLSSNYRPTKSGGYCELNNADDILDKDSFEHTPGALFYRLKFKNICSKAGGSFDFLKDQCPISSCLRSKCPSHTTCREMCHPKYKRYICQCPAHSNSNCEHLPRTCDDIRKTLGFVPSTNGVYYVFNSNDNLTEVYCDFTSEKNVVYTLIESFSFANKAIFKPLGFYGDSPLEENSFNWMKYRLSKARMENIASKSSHVRATCNMDTTLSTKDYLRAELSGIPLFIQFSSRCVKYEYLSMHGKSCSNCTSGTWQVANEHLHLNPGANANCEFGPGSGFGVYSHNFGLYNVVDNAHDCARLPSSTTQYWLGMKHK